MPCSSFSGESFVPKLVISNKPSSYDFTGERLKWKLFWTVFHVANAEALVEKNGKSEITVKGKISTAGIVRWFKKIEDCGNSTMNSKTLVPVHTEFVQIEGNYKKKKIFEYDLNSKKVKYTKIDLKDGEKKEKIIDIPSDIFGDLISASYFFRRFGVFEVGKTTVFPVFAEGKFVNVEMKVVKKEVIDTRFGKIEAYRVVPSKNLSPRGAFERKGKVVMWFSADERHLPLKITAEVAVGSVSAVLVEAKGKNFDLLKEAIKKKKKNLLKKLMEGIISG